MARREHALYVIAAAYDGTDAAIGDYEAAKALYLAARSSHDFAAGMKNAGAEQTT